MREILFRGKPIVYKELMEPNETLREFFKRQHGWSDYSVNKAFTDDGFVIGQVVYSHGKAWIVGEVVEAEEDYIALEYWVPVKPETVGQYTGLTIKGEKLFEHDQIRFRETEIDDWEYGTVVWCGERDYPAFDVEPWIDCDCNGLSYIKVACEVEIVGNKWDNPELVEVLGDEA